MREIKTMQFKLWLVLLGINAMFLIVELLPPFYNPDAHNA